MNPLVSLAHLPRGVSARICGFDPSPERTQWIQALQNSGFAHGDDVEILAYGPFGSTPLCVRLGRRIIGLRPDEAACILVKLVETSANTPGPASMPIAAE